MRACLHLQQAGMAAREAVSATGRVTLGTRIPAFWPAFSARRQGVDAERAYAGLGGLM